MSRHETVVRLRHMLDAAHEAAELVRGRSRRELDSDRTLNLALVRLMEIVGEAAGRVPQEERERFPDILWPQIVGLRNRLIHGYDDIDLDILWEVVTQDLPPLIAKLENLVQ